MFDGDVVCRAALYPKFITPSGVFDPESLLHFQSSKNKTAYSLSVASKFICRSDDGVHAYGEHAASIANRRFQDKNGREPSPVTEKVHYLGFYELYCGDIRGLNLEYYNANCYWLPENGADCHFQVDLVETKQGTKSDKRADRRAAVGALYDRLWGPKKFISAEDDEHREELEKIDLPGKERSLTSANG